MFDLPLTTMRGCALIVLCALWHGAAGFRADGDVGLVLEVAFEGLQRSTRHKSGLAMRFPRIHRIRWDKPSRDADELAMLERMLEGASR